MAPQLELFHLPGACSRVTIAALIWAGADFSVTVPRLHRGELASPAYRARNSLGQVPTLMIDGVPLTENLAVLAKITELYPEAGLLPTDAKGAITIEALSRLSFCSSQLHPQRSRILFPQRFCDLNDESAARVRDIAIAMAVDRLSAIEPVLKDNSWWINNSFSIADIYLAWTMGGVLETSPAMAHLDAVRAHAERVRATPLFEQVIAREQAFVAELEADGAVFPPSIRAAMAG